MTRERFYEIDTTAYLFGHGTRSAENRDQPEEAVRQWCAYELIRAYGIKVSALGFERSVKVGSKTYRIDILVCRDGVPAVVVECKPRSFTKHEEAMAQAVSYADAQIIQAEFAVYTNGNTWQVKRRLPQGWVAVPDLPHEIDYIATRPITDFLRTLAELNPLLYKLGEPLAGKDARSYLSAMQVFFHGTNLLTEDVHQDLRFGTDDLLRVLCACGDTHYQSSKFCIAEAQFGRYCKQVGIGLQIVPHRDSMWQEMRYLHGGLMTMIEATKVLVGADILVLRLYAALLDYGLSLREVHTPKAYPPLGQRVYGPLRDYLSYALNVHLNSSLPDPLDTISIGDIRGYCLPAWKARACEE